MNADRLLDAFNRLGDEPETVQQFRKLVVGLAMSGKLVAPDEKALTPSGLLKDIEARKRALVQQGSLRKQSPLSSVSFADLPKGITNPSNFTRLGEVARIEKGQTGIMKAEPGAYPLVVTAEERGTCDHFDFDGAAAIVPLVSSAGHGKASLQRLHYQEGKFALGSILAAIFPHAPELISARFLFEYLTAFKDELLVSQMIGTANVSLSVGKVADVPVPLVPPLVQHKVDELMDLCDRLEAARAGREAVRDRLAAASLARLNVPDAETFEADVRFALDALPALTTRPNQIKALRQTILNLAVRGKLVPQDPNDEPASEWLLSAFGGEVAGRGAKASSRSVRPLEGVEAGYSLPASWLWIELGKLVTVMDAGWSPQCESHPRTDPEAWGVLKTTAVQTLAFDCGQHKELPAKFEPRPQHEARVGDILVTRAGPKNRVGVSCVVDKTEPRLMISDKLIRFRLADGLSPRFFALTLNAGVTSTAIEDAKSGMAVMQMNISQNKLRAVPVPLPPLAEQRRIVAKVDALMALCDRLKESLTATAATRRRLLDALLAEVLTPADKHELEAAE